MLSNMHTLILGMIKEAPINPYGLIQLFNKLHIKNWLPYADSSIYAGINALVKKNYIKGTAKKSGRSPEKSVYRITREGNSAFEKNLRSLMLDISSDHTQFTIAILFMCHLDKEDVTDLLSQRQTALAVSRKRLERQVCKMEKDNRIPATAIMTVKLHLYHAEANARTVTELLTALQNMRTWNAFLSEDLK